MNWNRPNGGYESEPWRKPWSPKTDKPKKSFHYSYSTWKKKESNKEPIMTEELRKKIQALRKK